MSRDETGATRTSGSAPDGTGARQHAPTGAGLPPPRPRRRWRVAAAVVVAVVAGLWAYGPWHDSRADVRDGTSAVSREEMAARHGVDVNLIAVTAAGGLVELRFQVTDPDKAAGVLHDPSDRPVLVSEDTGETLVMSAPPHGHRDLQLGGSYYFLLANAHNAVRMGAEVTLVIGEARLEHLEVQG